MDPSYADEWTNMIPGPAIGLKDLVSQEPYPQGPFFTSSIEQEAMVANDKLQGFVGESTASLHMSSQFNAAIKPQGNASLQFSSSPTLPLQSPGGG